MSTVNVRFITGPAYFGDVRLARDVTEIILQASSGNTRKIVSTISRSNDPSIGIKAEVDMTVHPNCKQIAEAAIRQAMLLPDSVPVFVDYDDYDVMQEDYIEPMLEAVLVSQRALKDVGNNIAAMIAYGYR